MIKVTLAEKKKPTSFSAAKSEIHNLNKTELI
jgi:hypothetical protein